MSQSPTSVLPRPLGLADARVYLATAALVLGNLLLPMAFHKIPDGGRMFLPLFFFTLVAGWRYGAVAGVLTGLLSPLASHLLSGMPLAGQLSGIVAQSVLLGVLAAFAATRTRGPVLLRLAAVVLLHQVLCLLPTLVHGGFGTCLEVLRMRIPGILLQVFGGAGLLWLLDHSPSRPQGPALAG
jgi:thiamine transporter ThiT